MATFIPQPWIKVLQRFQHTVGGEVLSCTYGIRVTGTLSSGSAVTAVTAADADFRTAFAPELDSEARFLPAWGYWLQSGSGVDPETDVYGLAVSGNAAAAGTAAQASFPPNVAISLRKRTQNVGRKYRGRIYLPWMLSEGAADELGVLTSGKIAAVTARAVVWLGAANIDSAYTGLWLLHELPEGATSGTTPTVITSLDVGAVVVTQRRRLPRTA